MGTSIYIGIVYDLSRVYHTPIFHFDRMEEILYIENFLKHLEIMEDLDLVNSRADFPNLD